MVSIKEIKGKSKEMEGKIKGKVAEETGKAKGKFAEEKGKAKGKAEEEKRKQNINIFIFRINDFNQINIKLDFIFKRLHHTYG